MITEEQAQAVVDATTYRDWKIENVDTGQLVWFQILGQIKAVMEKKVPVVVAYQAPNSDEGATDRVENKVYVAVPLTETEAEFARALYEVVSIIEEHERREFFRVDRSVLKDRPKDVNVGPLGITTTSGSTAVFHPHGVNRNKLFHDLDGFARSLSMESMAGGPMTADAVS